MSAKAINLAPDALEPFTTPNWAGVGVDKANEASAALREALAEQPSPMQGWKLVPVEPTSKMVDATGAVEADMRDMVVANWKGMLAAAPWPVQREPLTDVMDKRAAQINDFTQRNLFITGWLQAEAAHNIKGKNA